MGKIMCDGTAEIVVLAKVNEGFAWDFPWTNRRPEDKKNLKRIRMTCPKCKRRLLSSVKMCHDGCCIKHSIPPHKPKYWWKKRKQ